MDKIHRKTQGFVIKSETVYTIRKERISYFGAYLVDGLVQKKKLKITTKKSIQKIFSQELSELEKVTEL